jgi:hypothetical protein
MYLFYICYRFWTLSVYFESGNRNLTSGIYVCINKGEFNKIK